VTPTPTEALLAVEAVLDSIDEGAFTEAAIQAALEAEQQRRGWKAGPFFGPIRVALTGKTRTPPNFPMLAALGKERSLKRVRDAIALLDSTLA
jgi:glutamyl/glutaminyl-tRNA synthetase